MRIKKVINKIFFIYVLLVLSSSLQAQNYHNAINQDISLRCNIRYVSGQINWTNPNLNTWNGGTFNRIGVSVSTASTGAPATQFIEIGWIKQVQTNVLGFPVYSEWINVTYTDINDIIKQY